MAINKEQKFTEEHGESHQALLNENGNCKRIHYKIPDLERKQKGSCLDNKILSQEGVKY